MSDRFNSQLDGATKLLSLCSTQWLLANIKDLLLEKLFFSLPIEEQNKIVREVVRALGEKEDNCLKCAATVAKLKEVCDEEIR
jgi:hypothetical protein